MIILGSFGAKYSNRLSWWWSYRGNHRILTTSRVKLLLSSSFRRITLSEAISFIKRQRYLGSMLVSIVESDVTWSHNICVVSRGVRSHIHASLKTVLIFQHTLLSSKIGLLFQMTHMFSDWWNLPTYQIYIKSQDAKSILHKITEKSDLFQIRDLWFVFLSNCNCRLVSLKIFKVSWPPKWFVTKWAIDLQ